MPDINDVVGRPQVHFDQPRDIAAEPSLSKSEKLEALSSWEHDAAHEELATGEGMPPDPREDDEPVRQKIEAATAAMVERKVKSGSAFRQPSIDPNRHVHLVGRQSDSNFRDPSVQTQSRSLDEIRGRIVTHPIRSVMIAAAVGYLAAMINGRR